MMPKIFVAIGVLLIGYGLFLDRVLDWIGTLPYALRLLLCFALILPPAFLMGFPMPTAMTSLARLGKDHMFLWAWGINGCFSVIGAAAGADHRDLVRPDRRADDRRRAPICWRCRPSSRCCCRCNRRRRLAGAGGDTGVTAAMHRRSLLGAALALPACCCRRHAVSAPAPKRELAPLPSSKTALVPFDGRRSPIAARCRTRTAPFLDVADGERRGHTTVARRHLLGGPDLQRPARAAAHPARASIRAGRRSWSSSSTATKRRSSATCAIARRCRGRSPSPGSTRVLVAPQFAVERARFQRRPVLGAGRVRAIPRGGRPSAWPSSTAIARARGAFDDAPVVIVAYSGGYNPAAFVAARTAASTTACAASSCSTRSTARYDKFAGWLEKRPPAFFVSAYGKVVARGEHDAATHADRARHIAFRPTLPAQPRARQRDVHRRRRRRQAHGLHDRGLGRRPPEGGAAQDPRLRARAVAPAGATKPRQRSCRANSHDGSALVRQPAPTCGTSLGRMPSICRVRLE